MTIIRAPRPTTGYTLIRNEVLRDSRLSYRARGLLAAILSRPDNWETSADALAEEGSEGRDAVRNAFNELKLYGYVEQANVQGPDGLWRKQNTVFDTSSDTREEPSQPTPENPASVTENPSPTPGKPTPGKPTPGNPSLIRTTDKEQTTTRSPSLGTRLDPGWIPSKKLQEEMRAECPGVDLQAEHLKFVDYWCSKAGKEARKTDWDRTWRNWIRNAKPTNGYKQPAEDDRSKRLRRTPDPIPPADLTPAEANKWLREARRRIAAGLDA